MAGAGAGAGFFAVVSLPIKIVPFFIIVTVDEYHS